MKTVLIALLTLVWAAASNHCKLELVPGLSFLSCCEHQDQSAPHQDDDCDKDGCATVENQLYKAENAQTSPPAPLFLFTFLLSPLFDELAPAPTSHVLPDAAPTVLHRVWQFSYRTALPPRAPSILS